MEHSGGLHAAKITSGDSSSKFVTPPSYPLVEYSGGLHAAKITSGDSSSKFVTPPLPPIP